MSANKAMMDRAMDALYDELNGMEWEQLAEKISRMDDEKRAWRILADLVEIGQVARCFDGGAYRYYLSNSARAVRDQMKIQEAELELHSYMAERMSKAEGT